jgi:hypothetical protein
VLSQLLRAGTRRRDIDKAEERITQPWIRVQARKGAVLNCAIGDALPSAVIEPAPELKDIGLESLLVQRFPLEHLGRHDTTVAPA